MTDKGSVSEIVEKSSDSHKAEDSESQQFARGDSSQWLAEPEDQDFRWSDPGKEEIERMERPSTSATKHKVKWRPPRLSFSAGKMNRSNKPTEMTKRIETKLRLVASAATAESQDLTDPWKARPANIEHTTETKTGKDHMGSSVPLNVSASECKPPLPHKSGSVHRILPLSYLSAMKLGAASGDAGSSAGISVTQPFGSNPEANSNQTLQVTQEVHKSDHRQYESEATNERLSWNPEPELPGSANGLCCCFNACCCIRRNEEKCSMCARLVCVGAALLIILFWNLVLTSYKEK